MSFEVFDKRNTSLGKAPSVTVQRRGIISVNRAAYRLMGSPEHVELLYDRNNEVVGLRPAGADVPHAYAVRQTSGGSKAGPVLVAGSAFTKFYDIDTSVSRRFPVRMSDDILCLELSSGTEIVGNRSRSVRSDDR